MTGLDRPLLQTHHHCNIERRTIDAFVYPTAVNAAFELQEATAPVSHIKFPISMSSATFIAHVCKKRPELGAWLGMKSVADWPSPRKHWSRTPPPGVSITRAYTVYNFPICSVNVILKFKSGMLDS